MGTAAGAGAPLVMAGAGATTLNRPGLGAEKAEEEAAAPDGATSRHAASHRALALSSVCMRCQGEKEGGTVML